MSGISQPQSDVLPPTAFPASQDAMSDIDGDGSSSLSEIEDKDGDPEDVDVDMSELSNNESEEEDDSEAETERLEHSPHKHKDVVLTSHSESKTYEQTPSKLRHIQHHDATDDEDDALSDDEQSLNGSSKSPSDDEAPKDQHTAPTSLEDSSGDGIQALIAADGVSRKRKRPSIMDREVDDSMDQDEPALKRKGSINNEAGYADDENVVAEDEAERQGAAARELSDKEAVEEEDEEDAQAVNDDREEQRSISASASSKGKPRRGRTRKTAASMAELTDEGSEQHDQKANAADAEERAEAEAEDEVDAAARNEEERKRYCSSSVRSVGFHAKLPYS
jgi:hypothetical protein